MRVFTNSRGNLLKGIMFLVFLSAIVFNQTRLLQEKPVLSKEKKSLKVVLPQASLFDEKTITFPRHYKGYIEENDKRNFTGVVFNTVNIVTDEKGYNGPINVFVGLDTEGEITGLRIIKHYETPSYVPYDLNSSRFVQQFTGKKFTDEFKLGYDVDGITRATITSESILRSVKKSVRTVARETLGLDIPIEEGKEPRSYSSLFFLLVLFAVAVVGFFKCNLMLRIICLVFASLILGFWKRTFISLISITNIFVHPITLLTSNVLLSTLVIVAIGGCIFGGRFYCGWLCPFAIAEDLFARLQCRFRFKIAVSPRKGLENIKYFLLFLVLVTSLFIGDVNIAGYEPFTTLFALSGRVLAWLLLVFFLGVSLVFGWFWCRYFCPTGAFLGVVSKASFLKLMILENCNSCAMCQEICPVGAIEEGSTGKLLINRMECIQCNECRRICSEKAIGFQKR